MAGQAKMDDSNIANYGSQEHKDLRKSAAQSEPEYKGAGEKVAVEIWRVEKMKIKRQEDSSKAGTFYSGDSYIILNTYKKPGKNALSFNVHFWLGKDTTQDESTIAAYKTVELDDLLDDVPVQYREVQGHESDLFLAIFKNKISYLEGGIESGFNMVKPKEYKPRLLQLKGKKVVRVSEVPCKASSLNNGDAFILDGGLKLWQWNGDQAGYSEKRKANETVANIKEQRLGKPKSCILDGDEADEEFWGILEGAFKDVKSAEEGGEDEKVKDYEKKLFRLSDATGELKQTLEASGKDCKIGKLDSADAFILDCGTSVYVWIGSKTTKHERKEAFPNACNYLKEAGLALHTPICVVVEGAESVDFKRALN